MSKHYIQGQLFRHVVLHSNTFEFNKVVQYVYYADSVKDKIASLNQRGFHVVAKTGQQNVCWPELITRTRVCETNLNTIFKWPRISFWFQQRVRFVPIFLKCSNYWFSFDNARSEMNVRSFFNSAHAFSKTNVRSFFNSAHAFFQKRTYVRF